MVITHSSNPKQNSQKNNMSSHLKGIVFHQWYVLLINQSVLCLKEQNCVIMESKSIETTIQKQISYFASSLMT